MRLSLKHNLPFTTAKISYQGKTVEVSQVLVDTGSATTLFAIDALAEIQIRPLPTDTLQTIRGVGGLEAVFTRRVDGLQVGSHQILGFEIEVGGMDYGFEINGILGMDFLLQAGAVINLKEVDLAFVS